MTQLLYVRANPKGLAQSTSLRLGQHFVGAYQAERPGTQLACLDLYEDDIPLLDADVMTAWGKLAQETQLSAPEAHKVPRLGELVDQFLASDVLVYAMPMWNFRYPPMVKAYMDAVAVAGKTFQYTAQGPVGLTSGKQAVVLESRGGYWTGEDARPFEHSVSHLKVFLNFLGVTDIHTVFAEGLNVDPARSYEILAEAQARAGRLARVLAAGPAPSPDQQHPEQLHGD
ncbi:NAD(P)H-dependent oxidoreductase [Deinococcus hohokamensis]|uniref:FMN dependent NADH:quinone oxidoreductase n=1 Tax=Deinococcus hohokamensis TaxID=309883 RepID=A0ABV9IEY8_9DEIO